MQETIPELSLGDLTNVDLEFHSSHTSVRHCECPPWLASILATSFYPCCQYCLDLMSQGARDHIDNCSLGSVQIVPTN